MLNTVRDIPIREVSFNEYKSFTKQIVDKCQLGFPVTISLVINETIAMVKHSHRGNLEQLRERFLTNDGVEVITIEEFNKGIEKDKDMVRVDINYYEGKNFIITDIKL